MFNPLAQFQAFDAFRTGALSVKDAIRFALFGMGEQGVWYDLSNLYTMSQDSAGTVPVTAVEQPVGRLLDISGRGNHAYQTTDAKRPVLNARVNMLTKTEDFSDPVWTPLSTKRVTPNTDIAPDGTLSADTVSDLGGSFEGLNHVVSVTSGGIYKAFVHIKKTTGTSNFYPGVQVYLPGLLKNSGVIVDAKNGAANPITGGNYTSPSSVSVVSVGNYWAVSFTFETTSSVHLQLLPSVSLNGTTIDANATGSTVFWGADVRPLNIGVGLPIYQRVNTANDYDTVGFPLYLRANGVGSTLTTSAINLTGTDKVSVWAGVRKQSDAAQGVIAELGSSIASVNGSVLLSAPFSAVGNYGFSSKGTTRQDNTITTYSSPITSVLMAQASISGPSNSLSVNGVVKGTNTASQGTGNYGNHVLNLFSRDGASLFFNGMLYQFILRGAETNAQTKSLVDLYMNSQTRAY